MINGIALTRSRSRLKVDLFENEGVTVNDDDQGKDKHGHACKQDIRRFLPFARIGPISHTLLEETHFSLEWRCHSSKNENLQMVEKIHRLRQKIEYINL